MKLCLEQVAQEVFLLSRVVRTFGSEEREAGRYSAQLGALRKISIRQCASYLLYLATNASLFHITKVSAACVSRDGDWRILGPQGASVFASGWDVRTFHFACLVCWLVSRPVNRRNFL